MLWITRSNTKRSDVQAYLAFAQYRVSKAQPGLATGPTSDLFLGTGAVFDPVDYLSRQSRLIGDDARDPHYQ